MQLIPPVVPSHAINKITSILESISTPMNIISRKQLPWIIHGRPQLYILVNGTISVCQNSDRLIAMSTSVPNIFGTAQFTQQQYWYFLRAETHSKLLRVDAMNSMQLLIKESQLNELLEVVSYYAIFFSYRYALNVQKEIYPTIRGHILELSQLPSEFRASTTILSYIQARTHLSRSSILNVVVSLRNGGYITLRRGGYLLKTAKIPDRY